MNEARPPVEPPDALEEAYRKASAADAGAPSEATRQRILAQARAVAESRRRAAKIRVATPAANDRYWWRGIAASLAVAAIAVALWLPRERREAAMETAPQALTRESPSPAATAGAPAATPEPQAPRDAPGRATQNFVAEPPPQARSTPVPRQAPPLAERQEARAGKPFRAPAAPPAAQEPAPVSVPPALKREAPAMDTTGSAVAPAAPPGSPSPSALTGGVPAAHSAVEEVVVTGVHRTTADETQSVPTATLSSFLAGRAQAKLATAINAGDAPAVRSLVPRRIGLESRDALGRTPLMQAVIAGQPQIVRYLIDAGADVNAADSGGATPLARARAAGRSDLTGLLEAAGAH